MLTIYRLSTKLKRQSFNLCSKLSKLVMSRETHVNGVVQQLSMNGQAGGDEPEQVRNKYCDYVKFLELVGNLKVSEQWFSVQFSLFSNISWVKGKLSLWIMKIFWIVVIAYVIVLQNLIALPNWPLQYIISNLEMIHTSRTAVTRGWLNHMIIF